MEIGSCAPMAGNRVDSVQLTTNGVGIHNGQGLGIFKMVGSEWLTSIPTSSNTLTLVTNCYNLF